jgi:hypothetical protein
LSGGRRPDRAENAGADHRADGEHDQVTCAEHAFERVRGVGFVDHEGGDRLPPKQLRHSGAFYRSPAATPGLARMSDRIRHVHDVAAEALARPLLFATVPMIRHGMRRTDNKKFVAACEFHVDCAAFWSSLLPRPARRSSSSAGTKVAPHLRRAGGPAGAPIRITPECR